MRRWKTILMAVVLVGQLVAVLGEYATSVYPRYFGQEVLLAIEPVDPRSLFRGQYARLGYEIAAIDSQKLLLPNRDSPSQLRKGQRMYVVLEKRDGLHRVESIRLEKPSTGTFIRGRLVRTHRLCSGKETPDCGPSASTIPIMMQYGIEAFFASPEKALEVEREARTRESTVARVMVATNGKAALVDVISDTRK